FLGAGGEDLLAFVEGLLLALVPAPRGEDRLLGLVERTLTRSQLFVALLEPALGELVHLRLAGLLCRAAQRRLLPVALRLALQPRKLLLPVCESLLERTSFLFGRTGSLGRSHALGRFALELLHPRGELARVPRELELALVELACSGNQLCVAVSLVRCELLLA